MTEAPRLKVAVLGLSGDPAHAAHVEVSDYLYHSGFADEVWWFITPQNPLKDAAHASYTHRRKLAQLAVGKERPWLNINDFEVGVRVASEHHRTYQVLHDLVQVFPEYDFSFVLGSDNWLSLHTWGEWQTLTEMVTLLVLRRPGYLADLLDCPAALTLPQDRWHIIEKATTDVSSTEIRKALAEGRKPEGLTEEQLAYCKEHCLYATR